MVRNIICKYLSMVNFLLAISYKRNNPSSMASSALNIIIAAADDQINIV